MKMRKVMAIKPHRYGTRHLTAGEEYEVPPRHAIALVAGKKAKFADKAAAAKTSATADFIEYMKPQTLVGQIGGDEQPEVTIDSLRMEATQLGIDVDRRWGVVRLNYEIGRARG